MFKVFFIILAFFISSVIAIEQTPHFQLEEFDHIAIATDLEPDDVLALKLIFEEAYRLYVQNKLEQYPIELIIVGEGNSAIKRMRMEKMLQEFLPIPSNTTVKVVEGRSTSDNVFTLDGEELFTRDQLPAYQENNGELAIQALKEFVEQAPHPLIIQLKPAQELFNLSLESALAKKTSVLFYGSFNFRKTIKDENLIAAPVFNAIRNNPYQEQLQTLLDHFAHSFFQVGIIESYGVLGDQSAVFHEYPWTQEIVQRIEQSDDPFLALFRTLVSNWNHYLFMAELEDAKQIVLSIKMTIKNAQLYQKLDALSVNLEALSIEWNPAVFEELKQLASDLVQNAGDERLKKLESSLQFASKVRPDAGIQFTLSDVIVALALADQAQFFTAHPVHIQVNQNGYLEGIDEPASNVFYYNRVDRKKFADHLLPYLQ